MRIVGRCPYCGGTVIEEPDGTSCLMCARRFNERGPVNWTEPRRHRERAIGSDHVGNGNQRKRENAREGLE